MIISLEAADDGTYSCTINGIKYMCLTQKQALERGGERRELNQIETDALRAAVVFNGGSPLWQKLSGKR